MLKTLTKLSAGTAVVWCIVAVLSRDALADSITVSETWKDLTQGGVWYTSTDTGKFNASLTIPGLSSFSANDWSHLVVTINAGMFTAPEGNFSDFMADAPNHGGSFSATNATFIFQSLDTNTPPQNENAFQMSFSRSGNTLSILGKTLNPPSLGSNQWTIVAWNYFDPDNLGRTFGISNDPVQCEIILQNADTLQQYADIVRTLYVNGINVITYDANSNELFNIQVSGSADFTPPVLTAGSPARALTTTNGLLTAQARATDNFGVANVEFFLNGSDYGSGVIGSSNLWFLSFALRPGANTIQTLATDVSGNNSSTNSVLVNYVNQRTNANAITFSEHRLDSPQTDYIGDEFDVSQDVGILNAALRVPGLQDLSASTWSNLLLTLSFGDIAFTKRLSLADGLTSSNAIFHLNRVYDYNSNLVTDVQMSLARSGNTLVLVYETGNPTYDYDFPIIANFYYGWDGLVQDTRPFVLTLQDGNTLGYYYSVARPVYITGADSVSFDAARNEVDNIQVSGMADYLPPTIQITAPLPNQLWSNAEFTVLGKAGDNVQVTNVCCSVNAATWTAANPINNWTNWSTQVTLTPGTNTIAAYAMDNSGNLSATNTVKIVYVLDAMLTVSTNGRGAITPNDNGALLQIGRNHTLTAAALARSGFAFANWTGGTNLPLSILTNRPTLVFEMVSNLMLQANFVDTNRPVLKITNVVTGMLVSNANFVVAGTATDNVAVAGVFCQLNGTGWVNPTSFAGRNWSDALTLNPGTNQFQAYAVDTSGNLSPTNTVKIVYVLNAMLTVSTNGRGAITPNDNGALLQIGRNHTLTARALARSGFVFTNWTGGTNRPLSLLTNRPTLVFEMVSNLMLQANFVVKVNNSTAVSDTVRLIQNQPLKFTTDQGELTVTNGTLQLHLSGPTNVVVVIESSPDLIQWQPIQTNTLPAAGATLSLPVDRQPAKFIRARLPPQ